MQSYSRPEVGRAVLGKRADGSEGDGEAAVGKRPRTPAKDEMREGDLRKHGPCSGNRAQGKAW